MKFPKDAGWRCGYLPAFFPFCLFLLVILSAATCNADVFSYQKGNSVVGCVKKHKVAKGESLIELARKFDLGYNEITAANPALDPFVPGEGAVVTLSTSWIFPDLRSYKGIVINLSEMRLYYFFTKKGAHSVMTMPIGIGSEGTDTPEGEFSVIEKIIHPAWHVPASIKREKPSLPDVMPPGPNNPLGSHALRLSLGSILIHGTNRPFAIGRKMSHGCIRLYPEDIPKLFASVPKGVKVTIVRQPLKAGAKDNKVYLEVHDDDGVTISTKDAVSLLRKKGLLSRVSTKKLYKALEKKSGIPTDITE